MRYLFLFLLCLALLSCNENNPAPKTPMQGTGHNPDISSTTTLKDTIVSDYGLLQGKWQHETDKSNFLVFDKNLRKEIAGGMETWWEAEFILSDHCENKTQTAQHEPQEKDRYISCREDDLCWYILSLTEDRLTLQYVSRGNLLVYDRVKE